MKYHFVEDDFSAFDSTQGQGAHETEKLFYDAVILESNLPAGVVKNVKLSIDAQARTVGMGAQHKYEVPYTRKSGDQNTSIGNTIINFFVHFYAIKLYNETAAKHKKIFDWAMMGLGDDNLLAISCDERYLEGIMTSLTATIVSLGLKPKMKRSQFPSYCSSYFMPVKDESGSVVHVLTPSVTRNLIKFGWTTSQLTSTYEASLERMRGNMLGVPIYECCPIMRVFHVYYCGLDVRAAAEKKWHTYFNDIDRKYQACLETTAWFLELYKLSQTELDELESYLRNSVMEHEGKPFAWSHETFRKMLRA